MVGCCDYASNTSVPILLYLTKECARIEASLEWLDDYIITPITLNCLHLGTGKTLAYLIPVSEAICKLRDMEPRSVKRGGPSVVVIAPTRELVCQIEHEASRLLKLTRYSSASFYHGVSTDALHKRLDEQNCGELRLHAGNPCHTYRRTVALLLIKGIFS